MAEMTDDEATLYGALPPEKAAAHRRGERVEVTAEEAGRFVAQANLAHQREWDRMKREIKQLQKALKTYGQHTYECTSSTSRDGRWLPCNCGWETHSLRRA
jgi:hypothetical protein